MVFLVSTAVSLSSFLFDKCLTLMVGHNKKIADMLSKRIPDTCVIAPNFFDKEQLLGNRQVPDSTCGLFCTMLCCCICCTFKKFINSYPWEGNIEAKFNDTTAFMNEKGVVKYSLLSFCWGASVSFNACNYAVDVDKISCSVNCHPSLRPWWLRFA